MGKLMYRDWRRPGLLMEEAQAEVGWADGAHSGEPRGRGWHRRQGAPFQADPGLHLALCHQNRQGLRWTLRLEATDSHLKTSLLLIPGIGSWQGCDLVWGQGEEEGEKFPQVRRPRGRHPRGSCSLLSLTVTLVHKGGRKVRCGLSGPWEKLCPFP